MISRNIKRRGKGEKKGGKKYERFNLPFNHAMFFDTLYNAFTFDSILLLFFHFLFVSVSVFVSVLLLSFLLLFSNSVSCIIFIFFILS